MYGIVGFIILWIMLKTFVEEIKHKKAHREYEAKVRHQRKSAPSKTTKQTEYHELSHLFEPSNNRRR